MRISVVELPQYRNDIDKLFAQDEQSEIIDYFSFHPQAGAIMQGTGGIRKLRWAHKGSGKSGGVRIIYYYHSEQMPLFLLTIFKKGEKDNLTHHERNLLAKLVKKLIYLYAPKHK